MFIITWDNAIATLGYILQLQTIIKAYTKYCHEFKHFSTEKSLLSGGTAYKNMSLSSTS